ncbi:MAG: Maf family protein [Variovorax sp.]
MSDFIYLASQSPRRAQLLQQLGVAYQLLLPAAGEDTEALEAVRDGEAPATYVRRVAACKLDAAVTRCANNGLPPAPVLCADTTVALGRSILGKPQDAADAAQMLARLSGRTHRVLTAVAIEAHGRRHFALQTSQVRFAAIDAARIARYVTTGEPMGKAGAYAIQGRAAAFVEHISGSHSGVVGLPLHETAELLRAVGIAL